MGQLSGSWDSLTGQRVYELGQRFPQMSLMISELSSVVATQETEIEFSVVFQGTRTACEAVSTASEMMPCV